MYMYVYRYLLHISWYTCIGLCHPNHHPIFHLPPPPPQTKKKTQYTQYLTRHIHNALHVLLLRIGEIPHLIFINAKDNLLTFAAVGNCFRGYIPQDICASKKLQTLAMDGLHSSTRCPISRNKLGLSTITKTVSSEEGISGEIPDCIFAMPMLKTLHLAGNNLVGSLPVANLSSSLVNISLSHNLLTGMCL